MQPDPPGSSAPGALDRRAFVAGGAAVAAAGRWLARPRREPPLFRISLAQWSLHRAHFAGELDALDFPAEAAEAYGLDAVEYVNAFFRDRAGDFAWLGELARRADDAGVRSLLIMVDGEGPLAAENDVERRRAIENHFRWIAAAAFLGCHSIRVNLAGATRQHPDESAARAADSLVRLAEIAEPYGLAILVENHGGLSSNGGWLAGVMRRADHPRVGTLPDFGNFLLDGEEWYDRYRGVEELLPWARAVSAKSHAFDADGNEVHTDYRRMLRLVVESGYEGWIGIEYEGDHHAEPEGIRRTKALLERVRAGLADR